MKNDPVVFDCPDPLSSKYPEDANAPYYCKVCQTWRRRAAFSRNSVKENVCRTCAKPYADHLRSLSKALWEQFEQEK